ncbi:hypothetical protein N356_gp027 [Cellulophaga phage phi14:2]|uniref:Uncharacterized protein n=1 Tax=Cellulophaga phage phi14:2 TaxID=1327990 RepID=S0A010_9CAUD|nr:hypothetical protein N356_gp027 [Cellulophaga phage phi14:2]AGO48919.1 hypothetical protein Phi14:2_gp041 [Cellulophaga phage phi14:2]
MTGFVDYLNSNDYLLQFYANSSDSHGLIPDNSYKFTDVRNVMPGVRSSDIVSDGNRNTLLIPGQDPLNPGEAAISVNYFSKNRIRFAGNLTDVKSGDNHTELLYGNYILNHMCRVVVLSSDKIFHVRSLSDKLNECKSKKTELLNEIQKLDSKIESYSWVLDYMSQNKIIKESKSLVKAKMLLASIKEDEADDNKLTNITELFELSI